MFAVFRSLHMKLTLILLLLITSLMAVVGAFLTTSISSFYIDTFYEQIQRRVRRRQRRLYLHPPGPGR